MFRFIVQPIAQYQCVRVLLGVCGVAVVVLVLLSRTEELCNGIALAVNFKAYVNVFVLNDALAIDVLVNELIPYAYCVHSIRLNPFPFLICSGFVLLLLLCVFVGLLSNVPRYRVKIHVLCKIVTIDQLNTIFVYAN